jgi:molybdenum cofactor cytidylyltransferase
MNQPPSPEPSTLPKSARLVAGVVLAAGSSTRMGKNKLLLELDGESLLRRAVSRAASANLDPVIVVVGFEADRVLEELAGLPYKAVVNPDYQNGLHRSLQAGIRAVPAVAAGALVMLADMPHVTTDMIATMVLRYRETGARLVISNYDGVPAPPMLYGRSLFAELEAMRGSGCGKDVVRRHRSEAVVVSWPAAALVDLDLPEDYDRARAKLRTS